MSSDEFDAVTADSESRVPLGARWLAVMDLLIAVAILLLGIDYPEVGLSALGLVGPTAWGLWRTRVWGWWCGLLLHSLTLMLGLTAYGVAVWFTIPDFGRPRGHMEFVTPEQFLVALTLALIVFLPVTALPVVYLLWPSVRQSFRIGSVPPSAGGLD